MLTPAISYARDGYPLVERICSTIRTVEQLFREHWPTSAAVYLPNGEVPVAGTLFRNPTLADTYARLLREAEAVGGDRERQIERARKIWSEGFIAEEIDRFCRTQEVMDVSGRPHRGLLTGEDMAGWQASVEAPISYAYGRYTVLKPGPWCQGLATLQQLAILKGFDLDGLDPAGPDFIHLQVEAAKLAFADRDTFYGDPDFVEVPVATLLSDAYNAERRKLVGAMASMEQRPGSIEGFGKLIDARAVLGRREAVSASGVGEPTVGRMGQARGDTVHFDVVDRAGNMIAATPSGGWLQSSPVIPALGFCLGTRAQMFVLDEDHPAALKPGKRPRSTLSPTLAFRDGEPYLAWGSPGGDQQDQWIPQFFLRHVHAGMNLQQAIDAPAWHTEHFPSSFWPRTSRPGVVVVESRVPKEMHRGARAARPQGRGRRGLVRGPPRRGLAGGRAPQGRRQSARHAGLCGREIGHDLVDRGAGRGDGRDRHRRFDLRLRRRRAGAVHRDRRRRDRLAVLCQSVLRLSRPRAAARRRDAPRTSSASSRRRTRAAASARCT